MCWHAVVLRACCGHAVGMAFAGMLWCFCAAGQAVADKGPLVALRKSYPSGGLPEAWPSCSA